MRLTNYTLFDNDLRREGVEYAAEHTLALGFDSVELIDMTPVGERLICRFDPYEIKRTLSARELPVVCYSVGADMLCPDRDLLEKKLFAQLEYAAALETPNFHHTISLWFDREGEIPSAEAVISQNTELLIRIADKAKKYGITCLYEPHGMIINGIEPLGRLMRIVAAECDNVGICGDVGNTYFADTTAMDLFDAFSKDIKHIHIKDYVITEAPLFSRETQYRSRGGRWIYPCKLGEGVVDLGHCLRRVTAEGYDGALSMEFACGDAEMAEALQYIGSIVGRRSRNII